MTCWEYIRIEYDGTLSDECALGSNGWEICAFDPTWRHLIMKREIPEHLQKQNREFYTKTTKVF